ncbi:topology modulation protein [Actinoplanes sp. ATCC 53533]|uniref:topology modulation protein n=1 Tax=Actinoplanes sp. ATCC 53533 TaxID=1288362 RepID=UPI000F7753CD|nr:topology modulation protein [Actinoplanes sp. ATCC 53533]RSM50533.1 topology modulation protein [Actinoplanes sp. ATCC 53533]
MQRIAIVGNGGAGKTVLANKLGRLLGIAVTHLDALRYAEDWMPVPEELFVARQREAMEAGRWIIDGNSLASLAGRVAAADTVIVVDPPPLVCLWGILQRRLRYRGGRHPDGVHDHITLNFLRYVCRFRRDHLPRVLACISEHTGGAEVVHLTSRRQADQCLAVLADRIGGGR